MTNISILIIIIGFIIITTIICVTYFICKSFSVITIERLKDARRIITSFESQHYKMLNSDNVNVITKQDVVHLIKNLKQVL